MTDINLDTDFYAIFDLEISATTAEVKKAYKKKALKCHPDKNPDNPKAAQLFHELTRALEVLLNPELRGKYDNLLNAREAARQRHSALDDKRKKFKEDLERREKAAAGFSRVPPEVKLKNDIERLRKEGEKLVQDEIKLLQEELLQEFQTEVSSHGDVTARQLKASWSEAPNAQTQYTEPVLKRIFTKYGNVNAIACSKNKAVIELDDASGADLAVKIEMGFADNPLKVTYASSKLRKEKKSANTSVPKFQTESLQDRANRQAQERKRLIEEMMKEDENS